MRDFLEGDMNKGLTYIELPFGQKYEYHTIDDEYNCLYMYWATDLLPEEIDNNIRDININIPDREINFIGSVTNKWQQFYNVCIQNGLRFNHFGATFNIHSTQNVSITDNMRLIKRSFIAPALQDDEQVRKQYIPCRIFKNISYGKMGMTNNKKVQELFNHKLIFEEDLEALFSKGIAFEKNPNKLETIVELMKYVRDNHTYLNRVNTIIQYIHAYTSFRKSNDNI
jgi:hypothetical protein